MAYHPASGKVVMFGGFVNINQPPYYLYLRDTWTFHFDELDRTWKWNQVTPEREGSPCRIGGFEDCSSPPAREESALAESPSAEPGPDKKNDVVMFGGSPDYLSDTWIWDGTTWLEKEPPAVLARLS